MLPNFNAPPAIVLRVMQIRASVHYFNNEEDLDRFMRVLQGVIQHAL